MRWMTNLFSKFVRYDLEALTSNDWNEVFEMGFEPPADFVCDPDQAQVCFWYFLRFALEQRASAVHFMVDREDECLRQLLYFSSPSSGSPYWTEALPMAESVAIHGLDHLRRWLGIREVGRRRKIHLRFRGTSTTASCVHEREGDLAIYFTKERPRLLSKSDRPYTGHKWIDHSRASAT